MNSESLQKLKSVIQSHGWRNLAWITDLDGTLLDIHKDPDAVQAADGLEWDLETIQQWTNGGVAISTGRNLGFVTSRFPNLKALISAEHHCIIRNLDGIVTPLVPKPDWTTLEPLIQKSISAIHPQIWLETSKDYSRTIHFRNIDAPVEDKLNKLGKKLTRQYNSKATDEDSLLGVKSGDKVVEIGPHTQDKGVAVRDILKGMPGRYPIFFGDSNADLPGGEAVIAAGGLFVSVGKDSPLKNKSHIHFDSPGELREAIAHIIATAPLQHKPNAELAFK